MQSGNSIKQAMSIDYSHSLNLHTLEGPRTALSILFPNQKPQSLLDVGCGNGTWLKTALEFGIPEVFGVDGVEVSSEELHIDRDFIKIQDLTKPWDLNKKFDVILCLEVAEHLDSTHANSLISSIVKHGATIYFSAACPGQPGQHHVNCQWPEYWQSLFNKNGYECFDNIREIIWNEEKIEPWYRQNIFSAIKSSNAGNEKRIKGMIHPDFYSYFEAYTTTRVTELTRMKTIMEISQGALPVFDYPKILIKSYLSKINRRLFT